MFLTAETLSPKRHQYPKKRKPSSLIYLYSTLPYPICYYIYTRYSTTLVLSPKSQIPEPCRQVRGPYDINQIAVVAIQAAMKKPQYVSLGAMGRVGRKKVQGFRLQGI